MIPEALEKKLVEQIAESEHPRELAVDVMMAVQAHYGSLTDGALRESADLLGMSPMELEELATFYTFLYREPVGRYVIHVCDSVVCWMDGFGSLRDHLCDRLRVSMGETTADGLFTLLPVCCIGYCDRAPAILINKRVYGHLTPEKLDEIIDGLRKAAEKDDI